MTNTNHLLSGSNGNTLYWCFSTWSFGRHSNQKLFTVISDTWHLGGLGVLLKAGTYWYTVDTGDRTQFSLLGVRPRHYIILPLSNLSLSLTLTLTLTLCVCVSFLPLSLSRRRSQSSSCPTCCSCPAVISVSGLQPVAEPCCSSTCSCCTSTCCSPQLP